MLLIPQIANTLDAYLHGYRYIVHKGATRSGKTYGILSALILIVMSDKTPTINSVVAMTLPHLKKGAIRDFTEIMKNNGLWSDSQWNATDKAYTFRNGSIIEFFSAESEKVHGAQRHRLFLNECQFLNYETVRQLLVRTSDSAFMDYNPIRSFWIDQKILNNPETIERTKLFHTTYLDNPFLSAEQVREIESNKGDAAWWQVYGLGETGTIRTGAIYNGWDIVPQSVFDAVSSKIIYGLDFGFSPHPTALVAVKFDKRDIYVKELIYETELTDPILCQRFDTLGINRKDIIIADYGGGGSQRIVNMRMGVEVEGRKYSFEMYPAVKGAGSIIDGITSVSGYNVHVVTGSENILNEYNLYRRRIDADGAFMPEPVDKDNHTMDAIRYVVYMKERGLF